MVLCERSPEVYKRWASELSPSKISSFTDAPSTRQVVIYFSHRKSCFDSAFVLLVSFLPLHARSSFVRIFISSNLTIQIWLGKLKGELHTVTRRPGTLIWKRSTTSPVLDEIVTYYIQNPQDNKRRILLISSSSWSITISLLSPHPYLLLVAVASEAVYLE